MKLHASFLGATLLLAACGGTSITGLSGDTDDTGGVVGGGGGDDGGTTNDGTISAELTRDLSVAIYDADGDTLLITLPPFDGSPVAASYIRDATLDVSEFEAFKLEENDKARLYYALFKEGTSTVVGVVATDLDFATYFGGTTYSLTQGGTLPTVGIATYEGGYAGLQTVTNGSGDGPTIVSGSALVNVDFNQSKIEGKVYDTDDVERFVLFITDVEGGEFFGDIADGADGVYGPADGVYGGIIGGTDGSELAATMVFTQDGIEEFGAFIAPQTCISGAGSPCITSD